MLQDPIADLLTRLRNAYARSKKQTDVYASKENRAILTVLQDQGSIKGFSDHEDKRFIVVDLSYSSGRPSMKSAVRVSKPSLRQYFKVKDLPRYKCGLAYGIVSTSKGMMTSHNARNNNFGGELICVIE